MECVSIERDASAIAWCPVSNVESLDLGPNSSKRCNPLYLLASVHQEMDTAFNSSSKIEILNTSPSSMNNKNNMSMGRCISKTSFETLTWGIQTHPTRDMPLGIIAGGMNDGSVTLWNPYNLISGRRGLMGTYSDYHQQKITAMAFNPTVAQHTFLATADDGETLYVWDLTKPSKPVAQQPPSGKTKSNVPSYPKYATALSWNNNVSYILAVSNCLGQTEIYDLRNKKVALTFESKNIDKALSISWNPNKARQLAVCYVKGEAEIWDLKQPKSPKMYLRDETRGHKRPILDLSWNCMDSNLLLTSGDDCFGYIWNGNNGKLIHQISFGDSQKLKVEWNNLRGGMLATMSTQNISIYNVNYLGDSYCPKWLQKQCGVTTGFGGKVVSFGTEYIEDLSRSSSKGNLRQNSTSSRGIKRKLQIPPVISVEYLPKSKSMIERAEQFKKTLHSLSTPQELKAFTDTKLQTLYSIRSQINKQSEPKPSQPKRPAIKQQDDELDFLADLSDSEEEEEQQEPEVIVPPSSDLSNAEIDFEIKIWEMIRLFFNEQNCKDDIIEYLGFNKTELMRRQQTMDENKARNLTVDTNDEQVQKTEQNVPAMPAHQISEHSESEADDLDFFENLGQASPKPPSPKSKDVTPRIPNEEKQESLIPSIEKAEEKIEKRFARASQADDEVRNAIIIGNYKLAIDLSLDAGNIADALVFAYYAQDTTLWETVSKSYFAQHSQSFIANTFCHIAKNDYFELVQRSDLSKWRETLAILLTFTDGDQFNDLCNNLGHRILENVNNLEGAIACFLCSQNISQLIAIWTISTNQENKKPTDLVLHSAITKALIYVNAPSVQHTTASQSALSSIFCKYANLLANQGSLDVASAFLQFVSTKVTGNQGRKLNDPQIASLIKRIASSQKPGAVAQQRTENINNAEQYRSNKPNRSPPNRRQNRRGGGGGRGMPGQPRNVAQRNVAPSNPPKQQQPGPDRSRRGGRGGATRPIRRDSNRSQPRVSNPMQPGPNRQIYGSADPQPQPTNPNPVRNRMPDRHRGRRGGRGRGTRGRGAGGGNQPVRTPNVSRQPPPPIQNQRRMPPQNNPSSNQMPGGGMNGSSVPPRNNMPNRRGGRGRGRGAPPPTRGRGGGRGRGSQRMPPSHTAPVTPMKPQPNRNINQSQNHQPMSQTPAMPSRRGRGRGRGRGGGSRGRGRGGRGGGPPRNQMRQQQQQENMQYEQNNDQMVNEPVVDQRNGHNPSKTSHGSGFFGETPLSTSDSQEALPDNAMDTVESIREYLNSIVMDENIMNMLKITQKNSLKGHQVKLLKDLDEQIPNDKMSNYTFTYLSKIFESLQNKEYDRALRNITDFTRSCKSKNIKFATHRKWVMAFQSIIRIAKAYNI